MLNTCLYSVHLYWWKRQVSHQRWIWGICCVQARKHASQGIHPGFEIQGRHHQKSKRGVSVVPKKGLVSYKIFKKQKKKRGHKCYSIIMLSLWYTFVASGILSGDNPVRVRGADEFEEVDPSTLSPTQQLLGILCEKGYFCNQDK